ncbi:MAG: hypothetical protein AB2551_07560 [Candidatus Thiodiazotropha sp.]
MILCRALAPLNHLRCFNCNRSCEQAPTGKRMEVDQIRRFVDQGLLRNAG